MENKYCWRCGVVVPFLNEDEFAEISSIYSECMRSTKKYREYNKTTLQETPIDEFFIPVQQAYEKITGFEGMNQNAAMHHRLSALGPDCTQCGKPLRTPEAKLCPECGWTANV